MNRYRLGRVLTRKDFPAFAQHVLLPGVLIILVISLGFYGVKLYIVNYEQKVAGALHSLIDDFEGVEFEEGTLAYEEELTRLAERFTSLYEGAKGSYNGKRALYHAGLAYYVLGEFGRAEELLDELFMRAKKFYLAPQALYFRGLALEELKRYEEAIGVFELYEELYGESSFLAAEVSLAKGRNYAWLEDYDSAEEIYTALIEKSDTGAAATLLSGALEEDGEPSSEQVYSEKAQELLDLMQLTRKQKSS